MSPHSAVLVPGEVVLCIVRNLREQRRDGAVEREKCRPSVLCYRREDTSEWAVMGLTTRPQYQNGVRRYPVPDWEQIPLRGPGYLWGPRLPIVPEWDIVGHLGWSPPLLRKLILWMCRDGAGWPSEAIERFTSDEEGS